jgi:hypothetical protein
VDRPSLAHAQEATSGHHADDVRIIFVGTLQELQTGYTRHHGIQKDKIKTLLV